MQAKSGKKVSLVKPIEPDEVFDADEADPGKVEKIKAEQQKAKSGKYGKQVVEPHKAKTDDESEETKTSWIEFEMVDESDKPVPGVKYEVKLPDGTMASGVLDGNGFARIDGIEPGQCEISFPDLDKDAWEKI
jgi:type VI secretion system secreted protein VgrG